MSGQDAIRGFSVQTLICLLDALETQSTWEAVTLEPDIAGDKVDILWEHPGAILAQQVKSSKNQISKGLAEKWCEELSASRSAQRYQLILAGPIAAAVLEDAPFHGVEVPVPISMDTLALIDQAVTRLDRYLLARKFPLIPLPMREAMVSLISARLLDGSIRAQRFTRVQFDGWLREALLVAYPGAVEQRISSNCDIIWSGLQLSAPANLNRQAFNITLPVTVINSGNSLAVVEWLLLKVTGQGLKMLYQPHSQIRAGEIASGNNDSDLPFSEFAINPGSAVSTHLNFVPIQKDGFDMVMWAVGSYDLELWVKYAGTDHPVKQRQDTISISINDRSVLQSRERRNIRFDSIGRFVDLI